MPRYHLHVHNAQGDAPDEEGADYPDMAAAHAAAIQGIRSFLSAELMEGEIDLRGHLDIVDGGGVVLASIPFDEAVRIRRPDGH